MSNTCRKSKCRGMSNQISRYTISRLPPANIHRNGNVRFVLLVVVLTCRWIHHYCTILFVNIFPPNTQCHGERRINSDEKEEASSERKERAEHELSSAKIPIRWMMCTVPMPNRSWDSRNIVSLLCLLVLLDFLQSRPVSCERVYSLKMCASAWAMGCCIEYPYSLCFASIRCANIVLCCVFHFKFWINMLNDGSFCVSRLFNNIIFTVIMYANTYHLFEYISAPRGRSLNGVCVLCVCRRERKHRTDARSEWEI